VLKLESVVLCPCAVNPEAALAPSRFCIVFEALSLPNSDVMLELALEAREFLTCPSVEAVRLSPTTIITTSWTRKALTSVPKRTS